MRLSLLALLLATPAFADDAKPKPKPPTPAEVKKAVDEGKAILIDVRSQKEWDRGHLKAAKLLPVTRLDEGVPAEELKKLLPKGKTVYLHCMSGGRSGMAEELLRKLGYDAKSVPAGYEKLAEAGFEKVEPKKKD